MKKSCYCCCCFYCYFSFLTCCVLPFALIFFFKFQKLPLQSHTKVKMLLVVSASSLHSLQCSFQLRKCQLLHVRVPSPRLNFKLYDLQCMKLKKTMKALASCCLPAFLWHAMEFKNKSNKISQPTNFHLATLLFLDFLHCLCNG